MSEALVKAEELIVRYRYHDKPVLSGLNLTLLAGEINALRVITLLAGDNLDDS